ncbi:MAG: prolipoprotein diacylglyceryl transferase [Bacteroides sp.]|nr:prolipoprotein diacylglyceryl transferase [Bacteroides sp.]
MLPYIYIFGREFPSYSVCAILGGIAISFFCALQCRFPRKKARVRVDMQDILLMLVFAAFGLIIGAKFMYAVTSIDYSYREDLNFFSNLWEWIKLTVSGGLVFYGGLIGAAAGGFIYILHYKTPVSEMSDIAFVGVPLFHAFGRVGCFLGGCCFGTEYHGPFSIVYPNGSLGGAPAGVELFPVQLAESLLDLILWAVLFAVYRKTCRRWLSSGLYLSCYGVIRFILEYFRGDSIRGHLGALSSSQFISIFIAAIGVFLLIKPPFMDIWGKKYDVTYEKAVAELNERRREYKEAKRARREYRKQYIKDYREYLKAKKRAGKNGG